MAYWNTREIDRRIGKYHKDMRRIQDQKDELHEELRRLSEQQEILEQEVKGGFKMFKRRFARDVLGLSLSEANTLSDGVDVLPTHNDGFPAAGWKGYCRPDKVRFILEVQTAGGVITSTGEWTDFLE